MSLYVWKSFAKDSYRGFGATMASSKEEAIRNLMNQFSTEMQKVQAVEQQLEGARASLWGRFAPSSVSSPHSIIAQRFQEFKKLEQEVLQMLQNEEPVVIPIPSA